MKNKHSKKLLQNYRSMHEAQANHFRAWKSGKKWVYGVGIATTLLASNEQTIIGLADITTVSLSSSASLAQNSLATNVVDSSQASSVSTSVPAQSSSVSSQEDIASATITAESSSTPSLDSSKVAQDNLSQSAVQSASSAVSSESSASSSAASSESSATSSSADSSSTTEVAAETSQNLYATPVVTNVASSNLNGFEIPLLSSLKQESQGALISEGLTLLGDASKTMVSTQSLKAKETASKLRSLDLVNTVYEKVFGQKVATNLSEIEKNAAIHVTVKDAQAGDVLVWKNNLGIVTKVALYLGQGKFELLENAQVTIASLSELSSDVAPATALRFFETTMTSAGQNLVKNYAATETYQENQTTDEFIASIADQARDLGQKYGVYASVMIAQAILESGSGTSQLSLAPNNNLFGVKGSFDGNSVTLSTQEDDGKGSLTTIDAAFAAYPDKSTSLMEYIHLIRDNAIYKGAWRENAKNYLQATAALTGKYATDIYYQQKLNSLIAAYHLTQYDSPKPTTTGNILPSTNYIPTEYREAMNFPAYNGVNYNTSGSYPYGQCTYYVYNRVLQLGGKIGETMGNGGDWGASAIAQGYSTSARPKAGDIVSFKPGVAGSSSEYGHVAFIEAVTNDGILVSEENAAGLGVLSYRVIPNNELMNGVTYIIPGK